MIRYAIASANPLSSYLQVTTRVPVSLPTLELQLPAWRPGRYELQHFAQKIQAFRAADENGRPLPFRKLSKDRWAIDTQGASEVVLSYNFFARQMDAGGSWVDETQLYLNPINCLLAVAGREDQPCTLELELPETWQLACGLEKLKAHSLSAPDYHTLVDSPLIASDSLQKQAYQVQGISFQIWIQGDCQPDWGRISRDFEAFTREQLELFGSFPVKAYHFLNQILPYAQYHGVEHSHSTVITLGPGELLMTPSLYKELLGISSHELFHTWNIKKIRPAEMMPYDYSRENYFRTGYVAEGLTTYYGDYLLARAGVFSADQYFGELNGVLAKHFVDYGHQNYSVADSSFDLWLDGYKPGIPHRKVSIYHKGALAALILDLEIRRTTGNSHSLDTVMQRLWQDYGQTGKGYTEADYARLVEEVAQASFQTYFQEVIYGTAHLAPYLEKALDYVGCKLETLPGILVHESVYGFKTHLKDNLLEVSAIAPGSPAAAGLQLEDELVAVNGRRLTGNLTALLRNGGQVELTVFRNKMLRQVSLVPGPEAYYQRYQVSKLSQAETWQKENFQQWLKQVH
ncbi:MAG: M61 family metallopeptidase [Adhaeribacter sp.]